MAVETGASVKVASVASMVVAVETGASARVTSVASLSEAEISGSKEGVVLSFSIGLVPPNELFCKLFSSYERRLILSPNS